MQHAPLHARVKKTLWPMVTFFLQCSKNTQWSMKFVPGAMGQNISESILSHSGAMGQNISESILSHCSIGSMEQIFIMFYRGPPLWNNFVFLYVFQCG